MVKMEIVGPVFSFDKHTFYTLVFQSCAYASVRETIDC